MPSERTNNGQSQIATGIILTGNLKLKITIRVWSTRVNSPEGLKPFSQIFKTWQDKGLNCWI